MPDEQQPVIVSEAVLNPRWRLVEVHLEGLGENLLVLRIEHVRHGNVDMIMSKPSAGVLRDSLNTILAQGRVEH